jgi:hypothetical protein
MSKQINKNNKNLPESKNNKKFDKMLPNVNTTKIIDSSNNGNDYDPNMKFLIKRLEKIEGLIENLAKTTSCLASTSKVIRSID